MSWRLSSNGNIKVSETVQQNHVGGRKRSRKFQMEREMGENEQVRTQDRVSFVMTY
jgi:hypothetical protein